MFALTPRLTLRPGWPEDAPALAAAIGHASVVRNLARAPWPYDEGDAAAFLALPRSAHEPRFLIFERTGGRPRLIGGIAIDPCADGHELGYWLTPDVWGRGYATEAGRAVIDMARYAMGLTRLNAGHFLDNPASGGVLAKLGFRATGQTIVRDSIGRGEAVPCALFALDLVEAQATMPLAA